MGPTRWMVLLVVLMGATAAWAANRSFPRLEEFKLLSAEEVEQGLTEISDDPADDLPEDEGAIEATGDLDQSFMQSTLQQWVVRIQDAYAENGVLPVALTELTAAGSEADASAIIPEGTVRHPTDAWGRRIEYTVIPPDRFRLRSYGPDHIAGTEDDVVVEALAEEG